MTETPETTPVQDPAILARIRANIEETTREKTEQAVQDRIESEKTKIREGDGSFWGMIKSFIFMLAEMFGFDKMLAGMFGMPIPEDQEVTALSNQVAKGVSETLTDKNFTYSNKKEFEEGLAGNIKKKLMEGHAQTPSFSEAQLTDAANTAAKEASAPFAMLFDASGKVQNKIAGQSTVDALAAGKFANSYDTLKEDDKSKLATLAGKSEFTRDDMAIIGIALAPKLADIEGRKAQLIAKGEGAVSTIADELRTTLIANKDLIAGMGGMKLDDAGLTVLADRIAVGVAKEQLKITDVSPIFQATADAHTRDLVNSAMKRTIADKVSGNVESGTALAVLANYNTGKVAHIPIPDAPADILNKYYWHEGKGDDAKQYHLRKPLNEFKSEELTEMNKATRDLYVYAVSKDYGANDKQRARIGELTGEAVVAVMNDPANRGITDPKKMGSLMSAAIEKRLKAEQASIDNIPGSTKIDALNYRYIGENKDLLKTVAEGFGEAIATNKDGAFDQLAKAQGMLPAGVANAARKAVDTNVALSGGLTTLLPTSPLVSGRQLNTGTGGLALATDGLHNEQNLQNLTFTPLGGPITGLANANADDHARAPLTGTPAKRPPGGKGTVVP